MSGHSKWSTIKRQKGKTDAQKGKLFTKIGREIAVAVKSGGADPETNARLRDIILKAKSSNVPSDNIFRSIKKAAGETGAINYESIVYEGYGPSGVAVIVECLTDNKNRTAGEVRHVFDRAGGAMGTTGCVSYMFENKGVFIVERGDSASENSDDELMLFAIDNGAEDFFVGDDYYEIMCAMTEFNVLHEALESRAYSLQKSAIEWIPSSTVELSGDDLVKFTKMLDFFEDNDDVREVFHNANLPESDEE